jgi:RimJ/RimL family protein N-acetyltransferase
MISADLPAEKISKKAISSSAAPSQNNFVGRQATAADAFKIMQLYQEIYQGTYPDPLMRELLTLKKFLENQNHFWLLGEADNEVVASVIIRYDPENLLAKAFGAVVSEKYRKHGFMELLLSQAIDHVQFHTDGVDVMYATTRTVHEGAQALTDRLGFKKLGIFPNSHKTLEFETHCLTAVFSRDSMLKRFSDYKLHARLKGISDLVSQELPAILNLETIIPEAPSRTFVAPPILEMIESEHFVRYRYETLKQSGKLQFAFFPFHAPNVMVVSPDQSIEFFCYHSRQDGYSVIIGGRVDEPNVDYARLVNGIAHLLRENQARYVEMIIRADKPKIIESILNAKFIPSAFFPAFQLHHGKRYDYVVMSKTFEIFDFQNIRLKGLNQKYLEEYFRQWKQTSLNPNLLDI